MGKRRLNGLCYYQCDWTALPMAQAHCYMPSWGPTGKLVKRGSYCNWESVVAHARFSCKNGQLFADECLKVEEYVNGLMGTTVRQAPDMVGLVHFRGAHDAAAFHAQCTQPTEVITGVLIKHNGTVLEVEIPPPDLGDGYKFEQYLTSYSAPIKSLSHFHAARRRTQHDLKVFYYPFKGNPPNSTTSQHFKMQMWGDVLLVQESREGSFMPRDRYISYTREMYEDQFVKKRKRPVEPPSMDTKVYGQLKAVMQSELDHFEQKMSAAAVEPVELSKQLKVARTDGRDLARRMKERLV